MTQSAPRDFEFVQSENTGRPNDDLVLPNHPLTSGAGLLTWRRGVGSIRDYRQKRRTSLKENKIGKKWQKCLFFSFFCQIAHGVLLLSRDGEKERIFNALHSSVWLAWKFYYLCSCCCANWVIWNNGTRSCLSRYSEISPFYLSVFKETLLRVITGK